MEAITSSQSIPGPKSALGWRMNLFHFFRRPLLYQRWLHQTFGNVVAMRQGDKPSHVFAFGADYNRQILTNPDFFEVSTSLLNLPKDTVMGEMFYNNLLLMRGEKHKQHRRLMMPAFHQQQIERYSTDMVNLTRQLAAEWRNKEEIELNHEMKKLTQRIAVKTLFGVYDEARLERMGDQIARLTKSLLLASLAPVDIPLTPYHRALHLARELHADICAIIAEKQRTPETDVLSTLIHAHDEDGSRLTEAELIGHSFTLFVAGHETTANALTWSLFLLSQHPETLYQLTEELEGALGGDVTTLAKVMKLPVLEGVVKESLRLLPPAGIGTRRTAAPCALGTYDIPENTNVFFSQMITHRIPDLYREPDRFRPERWQTIKPTPYEFLPFSAGMHMCIGWNFAMQEMKLVLAVLLQHYRFSVVPHAKITPNIQMRPVHGMPVRLLPPSSAIERSPVRGTIRQMIDLN
ncbi:cytochrome P450 [Paenibacillus sp. J5C_2022]|uniref:cytochrome P450 n=1 Tax=Paenibacillus sp. J5C2022 TaxID=2977129 RepID=UPI0021D0DE5C|nr:cytochrome P450 [Paenibacillus sp. J5C2022]MCU6709524.1 cytochrome P450 [Paenibacillus sp. J5C2022]